MPLRNLALDVQWVLIAHGRYKTMGIIHKDIVHEGITFASPLGSSKDCTVYYQGTNRTMKGGKIEFIVSVKRSDADRTLETLIAIQPYIELTLSDQQLDPYRCFEIAGRLFYDHFDETVLVPISTIWCHATLFPYPIEYLARLGGRTVHLLPLNKVWELTALQKALMLTSNISIG